MTALDPIRRDLLDHFDVAAQGLPDVVYEELCKQVEAAVHQRRIAVYRRRREIHERLAATSGA